MDRQRSAIMSIKTAGSKEAAKAEKLKAAKAVANSLWKEYEMAMKVADKATKEAAKRHVRFEKAVAKVNKLSAA